MKDVSVAVSVIVPVFNVEQYITQCLNSIVNQLFVNIEIICVYTESTDESWSVLNQFSQKDSRIKIVCRNDGGLGGARNYGLQYAVGEYVVFVDSDDWIDNHMLSDMYHTAKNNNLDVILCAINSYDDTAGTLIPHDWCWDLPFPKNLDNVTFSFSDIATASFVSNVAPVTAWNKMYRRQFLNEENLRFPENLRFEDNPFYYEMMIKAKRIRFTRNRYYYYRKNRKGSLQNLAANDKSIFDIIDILVLINNILRTNSVPSSVQKGFLKYTVAELYWRYRVITEKKRKFLQQIYEKLGDDIYYEVVSVLLKKGFNKRIIELARLQQPKVSIIVPVYNTAKYLPACIDSVLSQSVREIEVICVDDCSSDDSWSVLEQYARKDNRITLVRNERNSGAGVSRDKALEMVTGEFIFFLDSDDLLPDNDVLEELYEACLKNNALACAGNLLQFKDGDIANQTRTAIMFFENTREYNYTEYQPHSTWGFTRFIFNTEFILENNISFNGLRYYEDPYFFVKYMSLAHKFIGINKVVYLYRQCSGHHSTLNAHQMVSYLTSEYSILNCLKSVDLSMYWQEYQFFLSQCSKVQLLSHFESFSTIVLWCDKIFSEASCTCYDKYIEPSLLYKSYNSFVLGNSLTGSSDRKKIRKGFRSMIKALFRPIYHIFRNRMMQIVSDSNKIFYSELNRLIQTEVDTSKRNYAELSSKLESIASIYNNEVKDFQKNMKDIFVAPNAIDRFLNDYSFVNMIKDKKIFLVGTAEHSNIGDAAIVAGEYEFLKKYYPDYKIVEISTYKFEEEYPLMQSVITNDDMIFIHGGGNLGTLYSNEENVRRTVINDYPNNKIVILPQTIYFSDDESGKKELLISSKIYNRHKHLTIFTRGLESLTFAKRHFSRACCVNMLDSAHMLHADYGYERNGVLLCIRDITDESGLTENQYDTVFKLVKGVYPDVETSKNIYCDDIPKEIRRRVVDNELRLFSRHKVIVTDRLHGLIFSVITRTPCVLLSAYNQKIAEFAENFADSNAVFFIDKDISKLLPSIKEALRVTSPTYPIFDKNDFFFQMFRVIEDSHTACTGAEQSLKNA